MTGVPSGSAPAATAVIPLPWLASGSPTGVPSASRHTRTTPPTPSLPAPMMTGVPSGSAPAATAVIPLPWTISGSPTGVPSASRHTRTVPPSLLMMTGVPSAAPRPPPPAPHGRGRSKPGDCQARGPWDRGSATAGREQHWRYRRPGRGSPAVGRQFELAGPR